MPARETPLQRLQRIAETPTGRLLPSEAKEFTDWLRSEPSKEERAVVFPSKTPLGAWDRNAVPETVQGTHD